MKLREMVTKARELVEEGSGEASRSGQNRALYEALDYAYRAYVHVRKGGGQKALANLYEEYEIVAPRRGSNPCTGIVKLCVPGKKANDYYKYADAIYYANEEGWERGQLGEELKANTATLAELSDKGRRARQKNGESLGSPRPGPAERGRKQIENASALGTVKLRSGMSVPANRPVMVFLGRPCEGKNREFEIVTPVETTEQTLRTLLAVVERHANDIGDSIAKKRSAKTKKAKATRRRIKPKPSKKKPVGERPWGQNR